MKNKDLKKEAIAIQTRTMALSLVAVFMVYLALSMFPVAASLVIAEEPTKTVGATTIKWTSSFQDSSYTIGDTITMTVTWTVLEGTAIYDGFRLRGPEFTPKGNDPAEGTVISTSQSGTTVTVEFKFTGLHLDKRRNVEIGNAKFKLYLKVAEDIGGPAVLLAGFGVNVHVEDPQ